MRFPVQLASITAALAFTATLSAQANHFLLEETTIDTAKRQQFEIAQHDYCAAVVRGGAPSCIVLAPTTFSKHDFYLTMLAFRSFAHYDEGTYTSKGLTPEQAQELGRRRNPTIASNIESGFEEMLATGRPLSPETPIVHITELRVHPGYASAVLQALRNAQGSATGMAVYQLIAGGDTDRFLVMRYLSRFADLDQLAPITPSSLKENDASLRLWREGVLDSKVTIMQERPQMSVASSH